MMQGMRTSEEDAEARIAKLNADLASEGDTARIRYMTIGPSWYEDDDGWRLVAFWELPEPQESVWPSEVLWTYRGRVQQLFARDDIRVESYFRTREELESGDYHTGWEVPESA